MNFLENIIKKDLGVFFLFFVLSLLQAYYYLSGYDVVVFWDQTHPLNVTGALNSLGSFWNNSGFPGAIDPSGTNFIPFLIVLYILTLGNNFVTLGQFLFIFLNYLGSLWFSYKFLEEFYKFFNKSEKKQNKDISLWNKFIFIISSLFYTFNIFNLTFVLRITNTNIWLLPFLPLQTYLLLKLTKSKKINFFIIASFVFINSFFLAPVFVNLTFVLVHHLFIGLSCLFLMFFIKKKKEFLINILTLGFFLITCALWWFVSQILGFQQNFETSSSIGGIEYIISAANLLTVFDILSLRGNATIIDSNCQKSPVWCNSNEIISNWWSFIYIFFIIFAVIINNISIKQTKIVFKNRKRLIFLIIFFTLISVAFFIAGLSETNPFAENLESIYLSSPQLATAFRGTYNKVGHHYNFIYTILLSISLITIFDFIENFKYQKISKLILFLILIVPTFQILLISFSENISPSNDLGMPGGRFNISQDYQKLNERLESIEANNIVMLPMQDFILNYNNTQPTSVGLDILRNSTYKNVLSNRGSSFNRREASRAINYIENYGTTEELISFLKLLSIDTIFLPKNDKSFYTSLYMTRNKDLRGYKEYKEILDASDSVQLKFETQDYLIYTLKNNRPSFFVSNEEPQDLNRETERYDFIDVIDSIDFYNDYPSIEFNKINPSLSRPDLVFSENGNNSFSLRYEGNTEEILKENGRYVGFLSIPLEENITEEDIFIENFLAINFECNGCRMTLNVSYEQNIPDFNNDEINEEIEIGLETEDIWDRFFIQPVNRSEVVLGSTQSSRTPKNLFYDLAYPNNKATRLDLHIVIDERSLEEGTAVNPELIINNIAIIPKDKNEIQIPAQNNYCIESNSRPNNSVLKNRRTDFERFYFSVDVKEKPYIRFKVKTGQDAGFSTLFSGFNLKGERVNAFLKPTYIQETAKIGTYGIESKDNFSIIEYDLRSANLSKTTTISPHLATGNESIDTNICFEILGTGTTSLTENRLLDYLVNSSNRDKKLEYEECQFYKPFLSASYNLSCPSGYNYVYTSVGYHESWKLDNLENTRYLGILNKFELPENYNTSKMKMNLSIYRYLVLARWFSITAFIILLLIPISLKSGFNLFKSR